MKNETGEFLTTLIGVRKMKFLKKFVMTSCLLGASLSFTPGYSEMFDTKEMKEERLMFSDSIIVAISPMGYSDCIVVSDPSGNLFWTKELKNRRILSAKIMPSNGYLYVLSKNRYKEECYLTCYHPTQNRDHIWEHILVL